MKTNDYLLATSVVAYSYLFFEQNAGINFLIFNLLLIIVQLIRHPALIKQKKWLYAMGCCLLSSAAILINSSALAIIANCFSLLLLSAVSFNVRTSILISLLFSAYSILSSVIFMFLDAASRSEKNRNAVTTKKRSALAGLVVILFSFLFFIMYRASNPLFEKNTGWINFDFLNFGWIMFSLFGTLLVYGLFYHKTIAAIERRENELPLNNEKFAATDTDTYAVERIAGSALFVFLNLMLIVLNTGDIQTIWFNGTLPTGIKHSDFVHNGIQIIILSIIVAVSLIMFLFRKDFTEIKNSRLLKWLVYLWIIQNIVMLFSTFCRNHMYVNTYSLTYERVGVYAWLTLAGLGLITVVIKLSFQKSNWFLVRTNSALWFSILVVTSIINWDGYITKFNLSHKAIKDIDFVYLLSLSDANLPALIEFGEPGNIKAINANLFEFYKTTYSPRKGVLTYEGLIQSKKLHFINDYTNNWQSWDLRDHKITKAIGYK